MVYSTTQGKKIRVAAVWVFNRLLIYDKIITINWCSSTYNRPDSPVILYLHLSARPLTNAKSDTFRQQRHSNTRKAQLFSSELIRILENAHFFSAKTFDNAKTSTFCQRSNSNTRKPSFFTSEGFRLLERPCLLPANVWINLQCIIDYVDDEKMSIFNDQIDEEEGR